MNLEFEAALNSTPSQASMLAAALNSYRHVWPQTPLGGDPAWRLDVTSEYLVRDLPESDTDLLQDSKWPAFFPAPMCIVTTTDGKRTAMEREVGASIVNRFPYVVAISICNKNLSSRHHRRSQFMDVLEGGGVASLQFLPPGEALDAALRATASVDDTRTSQRIELCGLETRGGLTNGSPILAPAYLVYEGHLVRPQNDFSGRPIYPSPWVDVGSHRVYFLEINAIQLRHDIAVGRSQIRWRALPTWSPARNSESSTQTPRVPSGNKYTKPYRPNYSFPAPNTIAFEFDGVRHGMAFKLLPPLPQDQVEVDNDRARWPCFPI